MANRQRAARRSAVRSPITPTHHVQARVSTETLHALAQLCVERGVKQSEIVRDAIEAYLFQAKPGSTMQGPDNGYRIAKSTGNVIARQMLHAAFEALPQTWEEWKRMIEEQGDHVP